MATFVGIADGPVTEDIDLRSRVSNLGGYEHTVVDGVNYEVETWDLTFSNRPLADILSYDTFLKTNCHYFQWLTPLGVTKNFKCESWSCTYTNDALAHMRATFIQAFAP